MLGLHNLLGMTRDHDLPFEEQPCQLGALADRIVNSLPPTQRAGHEQTLKAPVEESVWNKKETTARGNSQPCQREEPGDAAATEGPIWSLFPASQPWARLGLAVCVGSASGTRAGRRRELQEKRSSEK